MKLFMAVLFATLALNGVLSLPARTEDAEVIGGPRRILTRADVDDDDDDDFTNFKGVIDTGSGYPFLQPNPSVIRVGFFDSFDDLFRRFSERLFPSSIFGGGGNDSEETDSTELGIPAIDPKKANSTSTVKVVDGRRVEVNETVYGDEHSVFKVRIVNIRPLEEGETVPETENRDIKPVTQGPEDKPTDIESNESNEQREPLEKKPTENEIRGNIDEPEHSIAKKENIVETAGETTIATTTIDTIMLPTTEDINAAFVTDNGFEQDVEAAAAEEGYMAAEELNGDNNGNGNNEFETNMSEETSNSNNNGNDADDSIDNVENLQVEHTIENNEDTEEEVNDNLNESSSSGNADVFDNNQENNDDDDDDEDDEDDAADAGDIEIVNLKKKKSNSNYLAATRNKEREDESSSDDEDASATAAAAFEMHPTFNDEWGSLNEPTNEQNDFSNDIDAYDVVPIDLSNDIAVNDAANLPLNPDAEFIDVYGVQHSSNSMPKFEKLSLDHQPRSAEDWLNKPAK